MENFLATLFEDKELVSLKVTIVPDNARSEQDLSKLLGPRGSTRQQQEEEERNRRRWLKSHRCDSDSNLIKPGRYVSPVPSSSKPTVTIDRMKASASDPSLLRLPIRVPSPSMKGRKLIADNNINGSSVSNGRNAVWDLNDLSKASSKHSSGRDSSKLFNLLMNPSDGSPSLNGKHLSSAASTSSSSFQRSRHQQDVGGSSPNVSLPTLRRSGGSRGSLQSMKHQHQQRNKKYGMMSLDPSLSSSSSSLSSRKKKNSLASSLGRDDPLSWELSNKGTGGSSHSLRMSAGVSSSAFPSPAPLSASSRW